MPWSSAGGVIATVGGPLVCVELVGFVGHLVVFLLFLKLRVCGRFVWNEDESVALVYGICWWWHGVLRLLSAHSRCVQGWVAHTADLLAATAYTRDDRSDNDFILDDVCAFVSDTLPRCLVLGFRKLRFRPLHSLMQQKILLLLVS